MREGLMLTYFLLIDVGIAYVLDLLIGDPHFLPHPVRFIGWLIQQTEKFLRKMIQRFYRGNKKELEKVTGTAGMFLAIFVPWVCFALTYGILEGAATIHPILFHILNIYFIYSAIATKCLAVEAKKVYKELQKKDLKKARLALSMLVGRETAGLEEKEIIRGVVETTAENTTDGVVSPLFYILIGSIFGLGAPLVYAFKAVSTLDSMVGYMDSRYIHFGRASAKFDDALNFIPARVTGFLIPVSAFFCGKSFNRSLKIMLRDRKNHKSPNSAYAEAAAAGALGISLGGDSVYFGKVVKKPTIGDAIKELEPKDILDTNRMMFVTSLLALLIFGALAANIMMLIY